MLFLDYTIYLLLHSLYIFRELRVFLIRVIVLSLLTNIVDLLIQKLLILLTYQMSILLFHLILLVYEYKEVIDYLKRVEVSLKNVVIELKHLFLLIVKAHHILHLFLKHPFLKNEKMKIVKNYSQVDSI